MTVLCVHSGIDRPQTGTSGVVRQGRGAAMDRPSRTKSHPAGSLSSSQAGRLVGPALFSLRTHWILHSLSSVSDSGTQGSHLAAIELYPGRSQAAVHNRGIIMQKEGMGLL
jgi:hypothetical protein